MSDFFARARLAALARLEWQPLAILAFVAACAWAFIELADEMLEGGTHAIDSFLLLALRSASDPADPIGPGWVEVMARDFTAMGGHGVLTLMSAAAIVYLLLSQRRHAALAVLVAVAGGALLTVALKLGFDRPRPDLVPHAVAVHDPSFPSGHSMMAAVTYLTLGALLARTEAALRLKLFWLGLALVLVLLVGASRVYLGVHWPSDVLAGWVVGAAWALGCGLAMQRLQRRGRVEAEGARGP